MTENEQTAEKLAGLTIRAPKLTVSVFAKAIRAYLNHDLNKHGKMTVRQLLQKDAGARTVEISNENIKAFEKTARRYGIDYALLCDDKETPPKWTVFFKAKDADALTYAFKEFIHETDKETEKDGKTSVREKLKNNKEKAKKQERNRERTQKRSRDTSL